MKARMPKSAPQEWNRSLERRSLVVPGAGDGGVVLADVPLAPPLAQEHLERPVGQVAPGVLEPVLPDAQVGEEVERRPDGPLPVALPGERRVVPGRRGEDPLTPELLRVVEVHIDDPSRPFRMRNPRQEWVEKGGGATRGELAQVGPPVQVVPGVGVPQALHPLPQLRGALPKLRFLLEAVQQRRHLGQRQAVRDVEAVEADILKLERVLLRVERDVLVHGGVVHAGLVSGCSLRPHRRLLERVLRLVRAVAQQPLVQALPDPPAVPGQGLAAVAPVVVGKEPFVGPAAQVLDHVGEREVAAEQAAQVRQEEVVPSEDGVAAVLLVPEAADGGEDAIVTRLVHRVPGHARLHRQEGFR